MRKSAMFFLLILVVVRGDLDSKILDIAKTLDGVFGATAADIIKMLTSPDSPSQIKMDPRCVEKTKHYYRTGDGTCNWIGEGHADLGMAGQPYGRDVPGASFSDGYNAPRKGPNPREISNRLFNTTFMGTKNWEHTAFLPGYVEFLVHDLMLSDSGRDQGDIYQIPVPKGDSFFDPQGTGDKTLEFWRTSKVPGTGIPNGPNGKPVIRQNPNMQTIWMDLSTVYGENLEKQSKLRTFEDGKLILEDNYLPLDSDRFDLNMLHRRGAPKSSVFASGDKRANQDFIVQAYHTLFAREHNRLCDDLIDRFPEKDWTDEELFLSARTINCAKFSMAGSAYFMAYYSKDMPLPSPTSVWWAFQGKSPQIPFTSYPWKDMINPQTHLPNPLPVEFSVAYRWHSLIPATIKNVTRKNDKYEVVGDIDLTVTAFNASAFKTQVLDNVLVGMLKTDIPHFKSGVQNQYRNMKIDFHDPLEGMNFDLAAWAIEHERERGVPTFNDYIRKFYQGAPSIKPRTSFSDFTNNATLAGILAELYSSPDEVDLLVAQELDPSNWPYTFIPLSELAISFLTLFKGATVDRFALLYPLYECIISQKPWKCEPTTYLADIIWKKNSLGRLPDPYWLTEFDVVAQGVNMLRRVVSQNTDIKCMQKNLYFHINATEVKNPILCWNVSEMPGPFHTALTPAYLQAKLLIDGWKNLKFYNDLIADHGYLVHYQLPGQGDIVLVNRINDFQNLYTSPKFLSRQGPDYLPKVYGRIAGYHDGRLINGLTTAQGEEWARKRKIVDEKIIPQFQSYFAQVKSYSKKLTAVFNQHTRNKNYELHNDLAKNSFDLMSELAFSKDYLDLSERKKAQLFADYSKIIDDFPNDIIWSIQFELHAACDRIHAFLSKALEQRIKSGNLGSDWLGIFAANLKGDDILVTTWDFFSGNIPFQISYGLYLLSQNSKSIQKIRQELVDLGATEDLTLSQLHQLRYLPNVVKEIQRYQPGGGNLGGRGTTDQVVFETYQLARNTKLLYPSYNIHHNKRYYESPNAFKPERWDTSSPQPPKYAFLTFGHGAMACPGKNLANMQQMIYLAEFVSHFDIMATSTPEVESGLTTEYKKPFRAQLLPYHLVKDKDEL